MKQRLRAVKAAPLTWDPIKGGRRGWICWDDEKVADIGADPTGERFNLIANRILAGNYYPKDAVVLFGRFRDEARDLRVGDRVLQRAPIGPVSVWSGVEIFFAERTATRCSIGYVTTARHHGRGTWRADLDRVGDRLQLTVKSTTSPNSALFWLGLPIARFFQLRARRRAIEEFRRA